MSDIATAAIATKQALTQHKAQIAIIKKSHEMQRSLIDMIAQAVENAPAPAPSGMGKVVDKSA